MTSGKTISAVALLAALAVTPAWSQGRGKHHPNDGVTGGGNRTLNQMERAERQQRRAEREQRQEQKQLQQQQKNQQPSEFRPGQGVAPNPGAVVNPGAPNAGNSALDRLPGQHQGAWLRHYKDVPADQQERALQNDSNFRSLP